MEEKKFEWLKGDRTLWIAIIIISVCSILPVYSASSQLQYIVNNGTTTQHLIKHCFFVVLGLGVMRVMNFIKYQYIGKLSAIILVIMLVLLVIAAATGTTIDGASAARWIRIGPLSFQPSTFVYLALIIYLCRYLTKKIKRERTWWENLLWVFGPVLVVFALVAKDNGSTAIMIMAVSIAVLIIGQFGWKYITGFISVAVFFAGTLVILATSTNLLGETRIHTWISRVDVFSKSKSDIEDETTKAKNYQVMRAKAAIVHGGFMGVGTGKAVLKNQLPQSASDFIFAIVVEEYGLLGASILLGLYMIIIMRIIIIAGKTPDFFGVLLVLSIGIMLFLQIAVNVAVAVNMIPVTGQPLPLISYGGTSMLVTYIQLGLVLNVSSQIQMRDEEGIGKKQSIEEINDIA